MTNSKGLLVSGALLSSLINATAMADEAPKVLMVLSSYGQMQGDKLVQPGYEFDEMSKSYLVLDKAGAEITFASPLGGKLITDKYDKNKAYNQAFLEDTSAVAALETSYKLSDINPADYDAVYVVGGKGPMFDLAKDSNLKKIIASVYQNNGVIGAVCHGPAALLDVKLTNGQYLVDGKRISAFTNEEESIFTKAWTMPFELETRLSEQGANFVQDGLMLNQVSIDGRIITGQNPFSTADSAKEMAKQLGLTLASDLRFKDDETVLLIEKFIVNPAKASQEFKANTSNYEPMLMAMFGLYQSQHATTQHQLNSALELMLQTQSLINHPKLDAAIAKAYLALNNKDTAKAVLAASIKQHPDSQDLKTLLATL
ncbi:DJ-1/PfpI family protein [Paraferrimonas sp. SM1919]|uniref:DJ-1/PfpI family protein n=1 Tax=Paraferrimonas sp. SM1919 TaxID=2662263 RepID=UPI0013D25281|nr:DJ-1/PfpI family protein [Paraferrimonas sp. SM1919]